MLGQPYARTAAALPAVTRGSPCRLRFAKRALLVAKLALLLVIFCDPMASAQYETSAQVLELVANEAFPEGIALVRLTA